MVACKRGGRLTFVVVSGPLKTLPQGCKPVEVAPIVQVLVCEVIQVNTALLILWALSRLDWTQVIGLSMHSLPQDTAEGNEEES